ncbi:MAG: Trm112 family protein [Candidatus Nanoarchaeia archaeon]|nr:Trm112 family protein [Candidatus Nanoarchaeia archaeon]
MTKELVDKELLKIIACPICRNELKVSGNSLKCTNKKCGETYPVKEGIPILLPPELRKELM